MVQLPAAYSFAVITLLLFVTVSAHTVKQAHHDLDMVIHTCASIRSDAKCITPKTAAYDGVVIVFGLYILNEQIQFTTTQRVPKKEPFSPEDEKAVGQKLDKFHKCITGFINNDLLSLIAVRGMEQHFLAIQEQLLRMGRKSGQKGITRRPWNGPAWKWIKENGPEIAATALKAVCHKQMDQALAVE